MTIHPPQPAMYPAVPEPENSELEALASKSPETEPGRETRTSQPPELVRWRSLLVKTTVWLSAEIILGIMGLDNLADYSEFILQRHMLAQVTETIAHIVSTF